MPALVTGFLGIFSLLAILVFYLASTDISENLSPQGCRMSWMSPSYVQQTNFSESWSPLSHRYSLWLYREVGWDSLQEGQRAGSLPVLFIPGNAGSSHQVRSIASSATRQYFSSPHVVSPSFQSRSSKPLDFFAVEFNEDLSAFHGSTLESQISYSFQAISYILSLYSPGTKIIVMGHSMGGVVAASLLPSDNISAIITMSTPHTLPPARFDYRIDKLYRKLQNTLENDPTPIVSICGGATDTMIPSELCILPRTSNDAFRRTVFTSALEGAWTGVGHREMVWCHQVRWRVARSALELGSATSSNSKAAVLDKWLRDGHLLPPALDQNSDAFDAADIKTLSSGQILRLPQPRGSKGYLLPVQTDNSSEVPRKITVLVSQGTISSVAPENAVPLKVSVYSCSGPSAVDCVPLKPDMLKLIPNPIPGKSFPVPQEGSDESEGVVLYESHIPRINTQHWIGIQVDDADGRGWVVAKIGSEEQIASSVGTLSLALSPLSVLMPTDAGLSTSFTFPNLLSNALIVYRVTTHNDMSSCSDALLSPLLMHTSHATETHYFPLAKIYNRRILLHTHLDAPFINKAQHFSSYVNLTIISSAESGCQREFTSFKIGIDWSATLGRWASRYLHTIVSWAAGMAALVVFYAWAQQDARGLMPSIGQSLGIYSYKMLQYFIPASLIFSLLPTYEWVYTGTRGTVFLAPIAPLLLVISSGLVSVVWWILLLLLTVIGRVNAVIFGSRTEHVGVPRSTILSLSAICLAIFVFVPWQVAYLGCWLLHLHTCAASTRQLASLNISTTPEAVPLVSRPRRSVEDVDEPSTFPRERQSSQELNVKRNNLNHNLHILLLMTWLLPLTAPVLAVWVRTLLTAGYTTPFDGDHNFAAVLPFLVFADFASWTPGQLFETTKLEKRLPLRWLFALMAGTAFVFGSRKPYLVLDVARVAMWAIVISKIGRRYWGGRPWAW